MPVGPTYSIFVQSRGWGRGEHKLLFWGLWGNKAPSSHTFPHFSLLPDIEKWGLPIPPRRPTNKKCNFGAFGPRISHLSTENAGKNQFPPISPHLPTFSEVPK